MHTVIHKLTLSSPCFLVGNNPLLFTNPFTLPLHYNISSHYTSMSHHKAVCSRCHDGLLLLLLLPKQDKYLKKLWSNTTRNTYRRSLDMTQTYIAKWWSKVRNFHILTDTTTTINFHLYIIYTPTFQLSRRDTYPYTLLSNIFHFDICGRQNLSVLHSFVW